MAMERSSYLGGFVDKVLTLAGGKRIVAWGYSAAELERLSNLGLDIEYVYTARTGLEQSDPSRVYLPPEQLCDLAGEVFVLFPCSYGLKSAISKLSKWGYREHDYATLFPIDKIFVFPDDGSFKDEYGNVVSSLPSKVSLSIQGYDNSVEIAPDVKVTGKLSITIQSSGNRIRIGKRCRFTGTSNLIRITGEGNSLVSVGEDGRWTGTDAHLNTHAELVIGPGTTIENKSRFFMSVFTSVRLGSDCMISSEVLFQANDGHTIFDVPSGLNLNSDVSNLSEQGLLKETVLGNHVWVGRRAMIMGGTDVGDGTIVGGMSFVKGSYPNNAIIAGIPARVIRTDKAWARQNCATDMEAATRGYARLTDQLL